MTPDLARRRALLTAALGFALLDTRGQPAPLGMTRHEGRRALMAVRPTTTTATVLLWLATVLPASGEMPVQSWLDFDNGNSRTVPISVARVMAATYTLGMADGFMSTQVVSCPTGYSPEGDVIAKRAANMLTAQPKASVTAAVLAALTVDGCTKNPSTKESGR